MILKDSSFYKKQNPGAVTNLMQAFIRIETFEKLIKIRKIREKTSAVVGIRAATNELGSQQTAHLVQGQMCSWRLSASGGTTG